MSSAVWALCSKRLRMGHSDHSHHLDVILLRPHQPLRRQSQEPCPSAGSAAWLVPQAGLLIEEILDQACGRSLHWSAARMASDFETRTGELFGSSGRNSWSHRTDSTRGPCSAGPESLAWLWLCWQLCGHLLVLLYSHALLPSSSSPMLRQQNSAGSTGRNSGRSVELSRAAVSQLIWCCSLYLRQRQSEQQPVQVAWVQGLRQASQRWTAASFAGRGGDCRHQGDQ